MKLGNNQGLHQLYNFDDELYAWKHGIPFSPLFVDLSPSSACNQSCPYCFTEWIRKPAVIMSKELLFKTISDLAAFRVKNIEFQGIGEPFLNQHTAEAISLAVKNNINCYIVNNGTAIEPYLKTVVPLVNFLRFSSFEATPEMYGITHGTNGDDHAKVVSAMKEAVRIKRATCSTVLINATFMLSGYNMTSMIDTIKLAREIGLDALHVKVSDFVPQNTWQKKLTVDMAGYKSLLEEARSLAIDKFFINIREDYSSFHVMPHKEYRVCHGCDFAVQILPTGKVYPCYHWFGNERYCYGDLSTQTFEEIWKSDRRRRVKEIMAQNDPNDCGCTCKQHSLNKILWEKLYPPMNYDTL
jgi:radical SAM protein with 4Fe4S-binding SPASM domain